MPWTRLRAIRPEEKELRRHSVLNPTDVTSSNEVSSQHASNVPITEPTPPPSSRMSHRVRDSIVSLSAVNEAPPERPVSPPIQERDPKHRRFSVLRFRHASDSQLAKTAKEQADQSAPPLPTIATPTIITTAPTQDNMEVSQKRKSTFSLPRKFKTPTNPGPIPFQHLERSLNPELGQWNSGENGSQPNLASRVTFDEPDRLRRAMNPPPYGDESNSALALPISRLSESSRSDRSSGDHGVFATTTTTHTVSTTTTFFRLPRRKKDMGPLFPLPPRLEPPSPSAGRASRASTIGRSSDSPIRQGFGRDGTHNGQDSPTRVSSKALASSSLNFAGPGSTILRSDSRASVHSTRSSSAIAPRMRPHARGRSSTMSSLRGVNDDDPLPTPPLPQSTRTSTSTTGRPSLAGLFNLSRLRYGSEPNIQQHASGSGMPGTPGSIRSNQASFVVPPPPSIVIPERQEGDTPAKYLTRLEEVVSRGAVVALLSKSQDEFSKNVLRSYMRRFKFFEDPLDMAVRKTLMQVELPKETAHIDRAIQSFADRYHECNPGIFASADEAYIIAFSIIILHTDVFNKSNKHKMQKPDYLKNTSGQGVTQDILECFYDNISYTPFIHVEDDVDIYGDRITASKPRKSGLRGSGGSTLRKSGTEPVDPYNLILDNKLDTLRPDLGEVLIMNDPFNYVASGSSLNVADLHRTFFRSGVIQILSSRSRPDAFKSQATIANPSEASAGVVDMKVTKVGILWRKDPKKKKARSPWQEWGAILTGSQLYFFRHAAGANWVKGLMHQHESHHRYGRSNTPVVFKPPLEHFKPDFLLSTESVVALVDVNYKKHKHAFVFAKPKDYEEVFLAENESEMNDWLSKLNYAAAFRTAGVRMRGVVGSQYDGQSSSMPRDGDSAASLQSNNDSATDVSPTDTSASPTNTARFNEDLAHQVMVARRQIISQKITEANERLGAISKQLDMQERNARHLEILAPVQQKTREQVVASATRLALSIRWARMEAWQTKCHRDILAMDLEEDMKLSSNIAITQQNEQIQANIASTSTSNQSQVRASFSRLNSRGSNTSAHAGQRTTRPGSQPFGTKLFSMDDIFKTPSRLRSQHRPQTSWELPPLSFDQSPGKANQTRDGMQPDGAMDTTRTMSSESNPTYATSSTEPGSIAARISQSRGKQDEEEEKMLVEAGLVPTKATIPEMRSQENVSDDDRARLSEIETKDGISKARHSLHRKLQSPHMPTHHRSKKGKDSSSTNGLTEDGVSITESEGLARGTGSFVVHGKKASVVDFGPEFQNMTPEERLKLRKQVESKLQVPPEAGEDTTPMPSPDFWEARPRPRSAVSETTMTTAKSMQRSSGVDLDPEPPTPPLVDAKEKVEVDNFKSGSELSPLLIESV